MIKIIRLQNGYEVCCTEPSDEYLGTWICEYNDNEYIVCVEIGG